MTHATKLSEIARLQHQIDLYSTLCMACKHDTSPNVVRDRTKLEGSLAAARELLARLKKEGYE
jgi:hypothetical protein